jgi:uncharacterized Zn-binding protein involved in type VI secretion
LQPFAVALLFAGLSHAALAEEARKPQKPPIILESTGAYEVGGKVIAKPGDPSQTLSCDMVTSSISSRPKGAVSA